MGKTKDMYTLVRCIYPTSYLPVHWRDSSLGCSWIYSTAPMRFKPNLTMKLIYTQACVRIATAIAIRVKDVDSLPAKDIHETRLRFKDTCGLDRLQGYKATRLREGEKDERTKEKGG